jgi:hypothetical protein
VAKRRRRRDLGDQRKQYARIGEAAQQRDAVAERQSSRGFREQLERIHLPSIIFRW